MLEVNIAQYFECFTRCGGYPYITQIPSVISRFQNCLFSVFLYFSVGTKFDGKKLMVNKFMNENRVFLLLVIDSCHQVVTQLLDRVKVV